jgi:ribosome-associated translation inhibitor RaiA
MTQKSDVIAERGLTLVTQAGTVQEVIVRLGKPKPSEEADDFSCEIEIVTPDGAINSRILGVDAFQALELATRYIASRLRHYRREQNAILYWTREGDDMGFPDPSSQIG